MKLFRATGTRREPLPESRIDLPEAPTDAELREIAEDVLADGVVDDDELAAALLVGGAEIETAQGTVVKADPVDLRGLTIETDTGVGRWLATPPRQRGGLWVERELHDRFSTWAEGLRPGADLDELLASMPDATNAPPETVNTFLEWSASLDVGAADWAKVAQIGRKLWRGNTRYTYWDRTRTDASEVAVAKHVPTPGTPVDEVLAAKLIAFAGMPGIPNRAVHEQLYALLDSGTFTTPEVRDRFESDVRALHHATAEMSLFVVQAPDQSIASGMSFDTSELAAGLGNKPDHVHGLVVRADEHGLRLFAPSPGKARRGFAVDQERREVLIEPGTDLERAKDADYPERVAAALAYANDHVDAKKRIVVVSSHGHGTTFGPRANDLMTLDALAAAIARTTPPDVLAFDTCSMSLDDIRDTFFGSGIRFAHASPKKIDASGYRYDRVVEDMLATPDDPSRWIRPGRWWTRFRPDHAYDGTLIPLAR